jgi:hypothetical protein
MANFCVPDWVISLLDGLLVNFVELSKTPVISQLQEKSLFWLTVLEVSACGMVTHHEAPLTGALEALEASTTSQ